MNAVEVDKTLFDFDEEINNFEVIQDRYPPDLQTDINNKDS